ncbi:MAG: hypothetical protein SFZ02_09705 [bacterium]|nr:hypothetical protein [bacterium]
MKSTHLLEELEFHDLAPFAEPLLVDKDTRILRWMFKPGQGIDEHTLPNSTLYLVILKGRGIFSSNGEAEQEFGANTLVTFKTDEPHTVRALDEGLVFVAFLQPILIPQVDPLVGDKETTISN